MSADRSPRWPRWLERLLVVVGLVCLGYYGLMTARAEQVQRQKAAAFEARLRETAPLPPEESAGASVAPSSAGGASSGAAPPPGAVPAPIATRPVSSPQPHRGDRESAHSTPGATRSTAQDDAIAMLEIPRLGVSAVVMSGDDDQTLEIAVGHLPDTPRPWEPGNSALAAHRDGLFRPLRRIRTGDALRLKTPEGVLDYRVRAIRIVEPDDLSVLAPTDGHTLTLITCYPFNYIGPAPQRFIVHADRVAPEASPE